MFKKVIRTSLSHHTSLTGNQEGLSVISIHQLLYYESYFLTLCVFHLKFYKYSLIYNLYSITLHDISFQHLWFFFSAGEYFLQDCYILQDSIGFSIGLLVILFSVYAYQDIITYLLFILLSKEFNGNKHNVLQVKVLGK